MSGINRNTSMRPFLALAAAAASVVTSLSIPTFAAAQSWDYDPCNAQQNRAERNGTVAGAVVGGILGSQIAGRGSRTEGTVIGAGVGALAGNRVGHSSVRCTAYPRGYRHHAGCRWVDDTYRGRSRGYEICQDRDGGWRRRGG